MRAKHPRALALASAVVLAVVLPACSRSGGPPPRASAPEGQPEVADFRAQPPEPGPTPQPELPVPERRRLGNGLEVLVLEKRELPLVAAAVIFKSGSAADPEGLHGLAGFVGDMLRSGTRTRSAREIAEEIETQGARLDVRVDEDAISLATTSLATSFGAVLDVVADVVQGSRFAADEIERVRKRRLAAIAEEKDDPESLAGRVFREVVFGAHPYGHTVLGDDAAIVKAGRAELVRFAAQHLRPANAAVVIVGDVSRAEAIAAVEKRFGGWTGAPGANPAPPAPKAQPPELVLVPKPGAPQSQLRVGHLGLARTSPDYFSALLMNEVLGGMFNSRINMSLREAKGYTYGAYSYFDFPRAPGMFVAGTGVRTEVTADAVREIISEIERMRQGGVTAEELAHAKNAYALSLPGRFQTVGGITAMTGSLFVYDLPLDYYRKLPAQVQAVGAEEVRRAGREHLIPDQLSIVVVGDPAEVESGLRALGRGELEVRPVSLPPTTAAVLPSPAER